MGLLDNLSGRLSRLEGLCDRATVDQLQRRQAVAPDVTEVQVAARRMYLRMTAGVLREQGCPDDAAETLAEIDGENSHLQSADEARFRQWCADQGRPVEPYRAHLLEQVRWHVRRTAAANTVIARLSRASARDVVQDIVSARYINPLSRRVLALANEAAGDCPTWPVAALSSA